MDSYVQAENHYGYLIPEEWIPNMNSHGRLIKSQVNNLEQLNICMSQYNSWQVIIESEWEGI